MKRLMRLCCFAIGLMISQVSVNAQPGQQQQVPQPSEASFPGKEVVPVITGPIPAAAMATKTGPKREDKVVKKGILAPLKSDVSAYLFLLSQEKTGLMRVLPGEYYDWRSWKVVKRVNVRGGGAYFSFHYRSHETGYGSDISYAQGNLTVASNGFLTDLGDTPLEPIIAADPRVAFSLNYTPPRKQYEADREIKRFRYVYTGREKVGGVTVDRVLYRNQLPAYVGHTYLVRSISYNTSDVLVAFRVVRKDDDGGLTIAWKILKEFTPPKLLLVIDARDYSN